MLASSFTRLHASPYLFAVAISTGKPPSAACSGPSALSSGSTPTAASSVVCYWSLPSYGAAERLHCSSLSCPVPSACSWARCPSGASPSTRACAGRKAHCPAASAARTALASAWSLPPTRLSCLGRGHFTCGVTIVQLGIVSHLMIRKLVNLLHFLF